LSKNAIKGFLNYEVEYSITRIFESELNFIRKIKQKVSQLIKCKDFDILDCFHEIDTFTSGSITLDNLNRFITNNIGPTDEKLIKSIIERLGSQEGIIDLGRFYNLFEIYSNQKNINYCLPSSVTKTEDN
jgi:hypothetical protein